MKVELKHYDYITKEYVVDGEIDTYTVAKSLDAESFAAIFETFINSYTGHGLEVGRILRKSHHTLQRLVVVFALNMLKGLAEQNYTDPRNKDAIETARKITQMLKDGELSTGMMM